MKIGILGSGDVGRALGRGFAGRGHDVKIGSRTPNGEKLLTWVKETGGRASTGKFDDAAKHGDVIVLAFLGSAVDQVIDLAGPDHFRGKLVIDATNPLDFSKGMRPGLFVGLTDSLGERIQRKLNGANVVKCFNTVPNSQMVDPRFHGEPPHMLICGNDAEAKKQVSTILRELGWNDSLDIGGMEESRWLEALVPLWARVGMTLGTWNHAFKVVKP